MMSSLALVQGFKMCTITRLHKDVECVEDIQVHIHEPFKARTTQAASFGGQQSPMYYTLNHLKTWKI